MSTLPDIFSHDEVNRLITQAEQLRYRVFILTTYSLGLRLSETLNLQVGDIDADSKTEQTRCLEGADFLWLLLQHILPRGFQRVRNYGYLHHNNKALLATVQLRLKVQLPATVPIIKPAPTCRQCGCTLQTIQVKHASQPMTVPQPHEPP